jgi:hypothetical protein
MQLLIKFKKAFHLPLYEELQQICNWICIHTQMEGLIKIRIRTQNLTLRGSDKGIFQILTF